MLSIVWASNAMLATSVSAARNSFCALRSAGGGKAESMINGSTRVSCCISREPSSRHVTTGSISRRHCSTLIDLLLRDKARLKKPELRCVRSLSEACKYSLPASMHVMRPSSSHDIYSVMTRHQQQSGFLERNERAGFQNGLTCVSAAPTMNIYMRLRVCRSAGLLIFLASS